MGNQQGKIDVYKRSIIGPATATALPPLIFLSTSPRRRRCHSRLSPSHSSSPPSPSRPPSTMSMKRKLSLEFDELAYSVSRDSASAR